MGGENRSRQKITAPLNFNNVRKYYTELLITNREIERFESKIGSNTREYLNSARIKKDFENIKNLIPNDELNLKLIAWVMRQRNIKAKQAKLKVKTAPSLPICSSL